MISSVAWVAKGIAKQQPVKYELDDEEFQRVCDRTRIELEEARLALSSW
jgi:hypothetical protein